MSGVDRTSRPIVTVELGGPGDHPAAWRQSSTPVQGWLDGSAQLAAVQAAEAAGIDLVTLDGALEAPWPPTAGVAGALDPLGLAARIAPDTRTVGLVPTVTTTHTEPFVVQASVATLDWVSRGRAGWRVEVSATRAAAEAIGRRGVAAPEALWAEAADVIAASRALWDSWEDDAEIRDVATGRFVDRDKLHYVDHVGPTFTVKGPSIVPRPPQGQPIVVVGTRGGSSLVAAAQADVVLVPASPDADALIAQVRSFVEAVGRDPGQVRVLVSASVLLGQDRVEVAERRQALGGLSGPGSAPTVAGTVDDLRGQAQAWLAGGADGVHLRPAVTDLDAPLIGELAATFTAHNSVTSAFGQTLRERLGLPRPASVYAAAPA